VQVTAESAEIAEILHARFLMQERLNEITGHIISAAIEVHRELGPGLLESAYEACLAFEIRRRNLGVERQVPLPLLYRGSRMLDCGYRLHLVVEDAVVVEVKTIERFEPVHAAQMLPYLRLSHRTVGLLLNFHVKWLTEQGVKRFVLDFPE
jgi:GxxExxY protein